MIGIPHRPACVLASLLIAAAQGAVAAAAPPPDAGSLLKQVQPVTPPAPASNDPGLRIEAQTGSALPTSAPFLVNTLIISGNTLFDTPTLHALLADTEGQTLTLGQLQSSIARLTAFYHARGFPLSRAVIPAQTIEAGRVRVDIIEARYGQVELDNHSRVTDPVLRATLASLQSGEPISQGTLDHALLLLSDIPGVKVDATLKPGATVGSSNLLVNTAGAPALQGAVDVDDYGNRYTGRARGGATLQVIDPLRHGDVLSLSALTSGSGMTYGRVGYDTLLNGAGTRLGVDYSALHYRLGNSLAPLDAHGTAEVTSVWVRQPFVRSAVASLYGEIQYDLQQLHDHVDVIALVDDRHLNDATASLTGDLHDGLLAGGVTSLSAGFTIGHVNFDNAVAQAADLASVKTEGRFAKWNANLYRLQAISSADTLYLSVSGQWTHDNLDSSQKLVEGGVYTVRGYDMGALSADSGYLETVEWRHDLGTAWQGRWQVLGFFDSAQLSVNTHPWAPGKNSATLSGAGLGLNWLGPRGFSVKTAVARRIGSESALVASSSSVRAWGQIEYAF